MRKLILKNDFSLGDVVLMTAAVRDLHRCYPGQFLIDVRTHYPDLWEHNPYITYLKASEPGVRLVNCQYPLINLANKRPHHALHGYIDFLNKALDLKIELTEYKGDIHLSREEKEWASQVHELAGRDLPFWIVSGGGKFDITIKWWPSERYQQVVNYFRGKIAFAQIGELGHYHPKLENTIDLRGQTSVRELVRLVYHSQGCLGPVTALMHLAAAVETRPDRPLNRACVVAAGGREPASWEAYPHHQFLHNVGALKCCAKGGCWKARTNPLNDGNDHDHADYLCTDVVNESPRCMDMITAEMVIRNIQTYYTGGSLKWLNPSDGLAARRGIRASSKNTYDEDSISVYNSADLIKRAIARLPKCPGGFSGQGIVICGGGLKYFPSAWVCISMLRHLGCRLPIELWYRGDEEIDVHMARLLQELGVKPVDARKVEKNYPRRMTGGWELKAYAIARSSFSEVLLLDADNVPVADPSYLFQHTKYKETGAIFWPDYGRLSEEREIWSLCRIPYRDEPEFESGQILINKRKCWKALSLAVWFNEHSEFWYKYIHGDKETFHLAWAKLKVPYTMIPFPIKSLDGTMCQHDPEGNRIFQHRNGHKWKVFSRNPSVKGFLHEEICLGFLRELEKKWNGRILIGSSRVVGRNELILRDGTYDRNIFISVVEKNEYALPDKFGTTDLVIDIGAHIGSFSLACLARGAGKILAYEPEPGNFIVAQSNLRQFGRKVRLFQKAVWRSDRQPGFLLHSGYANGGSDLNTGGGGVLVQTRGDLNCPSLELVPTVGLDAILSKIENVRLLKLDCEGSEWPILFTCKQLYKIKAVCGEYHELENIPTSAHVLGFRSYSKKVLEAFLRKHYKSVRIQPSGTSPLGLFWASN